MRSMLALILSLPLLVAAPALAQHEMMAERTVTVTGSGEATAAPDLAVVTLAVETEAETAAEAAERNAVLAQRVLEAVRTLLGEEDKVTTTGYELHPRYARPEPERRQEEPRIVGYTARNQVRVELHDLDAVGTVIDAALQAGANRVGDLQFQLEERGPHLREALQQAAQEARAQAEAVSAALGVRLGPVLQVTTGAQPPRPIPMPRAAMMESMDVRSAAPPPIEPGEVTVYAHLTVSWRIE